MLYALTPGGKRLLAVSVAAVLAVLAVGFAATSDASAAYDHCGGGNACAYRDSGGRCNVYFYTGDDPSWHNDSSEFGCGRSWDSASSLYNNGQANGGHYEDVIYWTNVSDRGYGYCLPRGYVVNDLAGSVWQDSISSHQWIYGHCASRVYTRASAGAKVQPLRSASMVLPALSKR